MGNYFEKPLHAKADWTIDQGWSSYTTEEHQVWDTLYERLMQVLPNRAAPEFMKGLDALDLHRGGIPNFETISDELEADAEADEAEDKADVEGIETSDEGGTGEEERAEDLDERIAPRVEKHGEESPHQRVDEFLDTTGLRQSREGAVTE